MTYIYLFIYCLQAEHRDTASYSWQNMTKANGSENSPASHLDSAKLLETARFLADAKSSLLEDLNVDNIREARENGYGLRQVGYEDGQRPLKTVSKGSKVRADRVRSYIQLFYHLIEKELDSRQDYSPYRGVEGVYNPLQLIRNRKIKKKLHHQIGNEIAFMKPPIVAIRDFSKSPDRDFPWFVDINEKSGDLAWRISNWDKLRKPDGSRWFEKEHKARSQSDTVPARSHSNHFYRSHRGSDQMMVGSSLAVGHYRSPSWELPLISVDSVDLEPTNETPRGWERALNKTKRLSRSTLQSKSSSQQHIIYEPNIHTRGRHSRSHSNQAYTTPVEISGHSGNLSEVPIKNMKTINSPAPLNSSESNKASYEFLELQGPFRPNPEASLLQNQCNDLKYKQCAWTVMAHRQRTLQRRQEQNAEKARAFMVEDLVEFSRPAEKILYEYRNALTEALEECDTWKSKLLNDYAIRVESLISSTDRVLSDINTTLTLRLKQLQEKIDKFGTLKRMNKEPVQLFLYRVLEVFIVLLFWSIWVVFIILKSAKIMILTLHRLVGWVVW
ncbi:LADA_0H07624g1_1 [Lachancea dasiensis]|uniref:LADA_0H07624g1_1 n=1 Tax=Lachancea dasiensis TaxID=1072105 RepID=A0A1G4K254_9SACH|nr:LADA_0H07624g1_1 [Lachancea dasiensis]